MSWQLNIKKNEARVNFGRQGGRGEGAAEAWRGDRPRQGPGGRGQGGAESGTRRSPATRPGRPEEVTSTQRNYALDVIRGVSRDVDAWLGSKSRWPRCVSRSSRRCSDVEKIRDHAAKNPLDDRAEAVAPVPARDHLPGYAPGGTGGRPPLRAARRDGEVRQATIRTTVGRALRHLEPSRMLAAWGSRTRPATCTRPAQRRRNGWRWSPATRQPSRRWRSHAARRALDSAGGPGQGPGKFPGGRRVPELPRILPAWRPPTAWRSGQDRRVPFRRRTKQAEKEPQTVFAGREALVKSNPGCPTKRDLAHRAVGWRLLPVHPEGRARPWPSTHRLTGSSRPRPRPTRTTRTARTRSRPWLTGWDS